MAQAPPREGVGAVNKVLIMGVYFSDSFIGPIGLAMPENAKIRADWEKVMKTASLEPGSFRIACEGVIVTLGNELELATVQKEKSDSPLWTEKATELNAG
ncbi:hypothetical protein FS837_003961 [Tulasnella sp. UAMH 9824]|nr:hypothetical protein FS837_003961 [Tulasnella sp. UAMH 9824]